MSVDKENMFKLLGVPASERESGVALEKELTLLFDAVRRLKTYTDGVKGERLDEPMRRDAVAHNFGLIAHGMLALQDIAGFQRYEAFLNRWLTLLWDFTWKPPASIDWNAAWEVVKNEIPVLEAELSRIAEAEGR